MKITSEETKDIVAPKQHEPGVYQVQIINADEGTSNNGTNYIGIEVETMGEDVFKIRNRFYQSPKALSILLNFLSAVGIYDEKSKKDIDIEPSDLIGLRFSVELVKGAANEQGKSYLEFKPWTCEALVGEEEIPF